MEKYSGKPIEKRKTLSFHFFYCLQKMGEVLFFSIIAIGGFKVV